MANVLKCCALLSGPLPHQYWYLSILITGRMPCVSSLDNRQPCFSLFQLFQATVPPRFTRTSSSQVQDSGQLHYTVHSSGPPFHHDRQGHDKGTERYIIMFVDFNHYQFLQWVSSNQFQLCTTHSTDQCRSQSTHAISVNSPLSSGHLR